MNPAHFSKERSKAFSELMQLLGKNLQSDWDVAVTRMTQGSSVVKENQLSRSDAEDFLEELTEDENIPVREDDGKVLRTDL